MNGITIRKSGLTSGEHIVVSIQSEGTNPSRRLGYAAGRYAKDVGEARAMNAKAVRRSIEYDHTMGMWYATYEIVTEHLPMGEMFRQIRESNAKAS